MKKSSTWGTYYELYAASELFRFNYVVYCAETCQVHTSMKHNKDFPTIYLEFRNGNHFNSLIQKGKVDFPLIYKDIERLSSSFKNRNNQKSKNEEFDTEKNLNKIMPEKIIEIQKYKTLLYKQKKHQALYPFAKNESDIYNEAYQFLTKKVIPNRFSEKNDKSNNNKFINWNKKVFKNYGIKTSRQSNLSTSRLYIKSSKGKESIIPFQDEINNIIHSFHTNYGQLQEKHYGNNTTLANIQQRGFYWAKMNNDIKEFITNCEVCNYNKIEEPLKAPVIIVSKGPLHRIQGDLWQIPKKIYQSIGKTHLYIITCVDHFSKYKWCYLIKDKQPQTIKQILELVFSTFKPPAIFHTDNGGEFKNGIIQEFLAYHQVEPVYGAPRHPQSQGAVERSNYWLGLHIKKAYEAWISKQPDENQLWDISLELMKFVSAENNRVHNVTKEIPNILVLSENKELIETIKHRIQNRYYSQTEN